MAALALNLDQTKIKMDYLYISLDTPDIKYKGNTYLMTDNYSGFIIIHVIKDSKD